MAVPDRLAQRVFVLACNPEKHRIGLGTNLGAMLRAASLADLHRSGHLVDDRGRPAVVVRPPCDDPVLGALLDEIAGAKPYTWQSWIGHRQGAAIRAVRRQLSDDGWVHCRPGRILGLFPTTTVTVRDPGVRRELLDRITAALHEPVDGIDPDDAALVAIIAAGDLTLVLDRRTERANRQRIRELTTLSEPVGPALLASIRAAATGEI